MQRTIILRNQPVEYELKTSLRSRRMRLAVYPGGRFVVSIPKRLDERHIDKFLFEKADWILAKIDLMRSKGRGTPLPNETEPISKIELKRLKVVALELVHRRLEYFNDYYKFTYHNVSIRNQKTRWGSCSRQGNLNFNAKIALLPPHLADYIIVHELCHLKEMNHSPRFWKLVAQTFPEHKELRRTLRKEHLAL